jgi:hypothetical protein
MQANILSTNYVFLVVLCERFQQSLETPITMEHKQGFGQEQSIHPSTFDWRISLFLSRFCYDKSAALSSFLMHENTWMGSTILAATAPARTFLANAEYGRAEMVGLAPVFRHTMPKLQKLDHFEASMND